MSWAHSADEGNKKYTQVWGKTHEKQPFGKSWRICQEYIHIRVTKIARARTGPRTHLYFREVL
jgi:hypothetical protein